MKNIRSQSSGLTLIELMVALAVASIMLLGAVRLYAHAGSMFRAAQAEQSLEETAQLAISALRHDIERAGFRAFLPYGEPITEDALQQTTVAVRSDCGEDWAIRLDVPVGGGDNGYRWECGAYARSAAPGADTLVLRYVDPEPVDELETGRIYLQSSARGAAQIFVAPHGPELSDDPLLTTHLLHARGYYVSTTSAGSTRGASVPSLRVKHLTLRNGRPVIVDEEVQPGVEDLQVEFDTGIDRFVTAAELVPGDHVHAIRIWLLVRSAFRENDAVAFIAAYAGRSAGSVPDGYRRRLVTTTIAITDDRPL